MEDTTKKLTGKHILVYLALFFGVVTVVNAVFITKAIESNTGVVTDRPYERGLNYNQVLDKAEQQKALGWKAVTALTEDDVLVYTLHDKEDKPLKGAAVTVQMLRPAQKGEDFSLTLSETSAGRYESKINAPLKGAWTAHIAVTYGDVSYNDITSLVLQ